MNQLSNNRTIINIIGVPSIIYLLWNGGLLFALFVLLVMIIGMNEFYRLTTNKDQSPLNIVGYIFTFILAGYYYMSNNLNSFTIISERELLSYFLSILIIILFMIEMSRNIKNPTKNIAITIFGILYVPLLLGTLIALRNLDTANHTYFTICMIISIWLCDSAAYVFGLKWGTKKILPKISPNKSWVGCIAGLSSSFIIYAIFKYQAILPEITTVDIFVLALITGFFGQAGDFAESLIKRDLGVKDSGTLLLGHGGVLDRFDSIIFSSPLTYIYLNLFYFPRVS